MNEICRCEHGVQYFKGESKSNCCNKCKYELDKLVASLSPSKNALRMGGAIKAKNKPEDGE